MTEPALIELSKMMALKLGSVDPSKHSDETFDLYSIPSFDKGEPEVKTGAEIGSTKQIVEPGDVLLSKIVPHIRRAWVVGPTQGRRIIASGEWIVFRGPRVHPQYLRHVLVGDPFHAQFMRTVSGVGGSLLRARPSYVAKISIPLPPISEQRRIAEVLDRAEALRAKRRAALAQLDTLTQSIFLEMFGDPVANPRKWLDDTLLGDVAEVVSGITKGRKLVGKQSRAVPYLAVSNVQDRALDLSVIKTIEASEDEIDRFRLHPDDLVLTEGGDPDKLGRGTLWKGEVPECIHQNHIFRVRLKTKRLDPLFLNWLIGSERGKRYFMRSAKQTTGIASINMTQLRAFPLLVPPIELQSIFARKAGAVDLLVAGHKAALGETEGLFASLQHRAFRGEA